MLNCVNYFHTVVFVNGWCNESLCRTSILLVVENQDDCPTSSSFPSNIWYPLYRQIEMVERFIIPHFLQRGAFDEADLSPIHAYRLPHQTHP